ncbi:phosphoribosylanthranilate isomerase [Cohnella sp. CFH 77786]|uniref:phosphoribosylanthranilate isomerase n=1 Tax=Cohnella sp. CFH 77786 TaxID=2662265 RepID=UPI001C60C917|nr:phosphoribosylanthranilate isomerase [Cohnella sp. CFH 77786]MBW5446628.1 phosphoribosylanthranilate isomerase [Cohnella sp. CFH 77786]
MTESTSKPMVKICGLRQESTLQGMDGLPVDYVGYVFAPSKRQVTAEQAANLRAAASGVRMREGKPPRSVGVFVNPTMERLTEVLDVVPLDVIQLHGQETPAFCREVAGRFGVEVWRALSAGDGEDNDPALTGADRLADYGGAVSTVLIDTAGGGTGRTFRWETIPAYLEQARRHGLRLFVAGGLSPDNVTELLAAYRPDGVDISSGVETEGVKDIRKIAAFAERVNRS